MLGKDGEFEIEQSSSTSKERTVTQNDSLKNLTSVEQSKGEKTPEYTPGEETLRKMEHEQKVKGFIKWLVDEEKKVLVRAERAVEEKEVVH